MILNNMKTLLELGSLAGGMFYNQSTALNVTLPNPIKSVTGTEISKINIAQTTSYTYGLLTPFSYFYPSNYFTTSESTVNVGFSYIMAGEGSTPVSADDYCLDNPITSGLTGGTLTPTITANLSADGKTYTRKCRIKFTLTNSSSENKTINEFGFYGGVGYNGSKSALSVLLHRVVLDAPVTIEPSAVGSFEFEFTFTSNLA